LLVNGDSLLKPTSLFFSISTRPARCVIKVILPALEIECGFPCFPPMRTESELLRICSVTASAVSGQRVHFSFRPLHPCLVFDDAMVFVTSMLSCCACATKLLRRSGLLGTAVPSNKVPAGGVFVRLGKLGEVDGFVGALSESSAVSTLCHRHGAFLFRLRSFLDGARALSSIIVNDSGRSVSTLAVRMEYIALNIVPLYSFCEPWRWAGLPSSLGWENEKKERSRLLSSTY
jgi:hypothetical protein